MKASENLVVERDLEDMDLAPGRDRAGMHRHLHQISCPREAFMAVKMWLPTRLIPVGVQAEKWFIGYEKPRRGKENGCDSRFVGGGDLRKMTSAEQAKCKKKETLCLPREHRHLGLRLGRLDTAAALAASRY
jgi:hypothetical protein